MLEIIPVEWADWLSKVFTDKDYDLTIVSHTEPNDIDIYSRKDYYFNYDNPAFDKVIDELNLTTDEAKRKELLRAGAEDPGRRRRRSASCSSCRRSASGTPRSRACGRTRRSRRTT